MLSNNPLLEKIEKETVKAIKEVFGNRIKQSFLIQMRREVQNSMGSELFQYYGNMFQMSTK